MPHHFALPKRRQQIGNKCPQAARRENWMRPPFGEGFVRPAEKMDFGSRAGEIAEIVFAPRQPRDNWQRRAQRERNQ